MSNVPDSPANNVPVKFHINKCEYYCDTDKEIFSTLIQHIMPVIMYMSGEALKELLQGVKEMVDEESLHIAKTSRTAINFFKSLSNIPDSKMNESTINFMLSLEGLGANQR